ncbi:MAG: NDP-sugar synthase [Kiritimatiellia bacterium]
MNKDLTLLVLAAGMGSRFGGLKQVEPFGPNGETLMDYSVYDALQAGFKRIVFVIRKDFEEIFREKVAAKYAGHFDIQFAFQSADDLPEGFTCPQERTKPWGTAHAIRAARSLISGPFAAINADDFYGADAFKRLADFLKQGAQFTFAMVGYRLDQTLSENGSVARGVTSVAEDGTLLSIREMTKIAKTPDGIANLENPNAPEPLKGDERVSMNLWGFSPVLFKEMERRFPQWLEANATNPKAEWYIPFLVDELVKACEVNVKVIPTDSRWFGVTYKDDKERVTRAIRELVDQGAYPAPLFG